MVSFYMSAALIVSRHSAPVCPLPSLTSRSSDGLRVRSLAEFALAIELIDIHLTATRQS